MFRPVFAILKPIDNDCGYIYRLVLDIVKNIYSDCG